MSEDQIHQPSVKRMTKKLVDKLFVNQKNHYQTFKDFDKDHDGFVSYRDFSDKVKEMQIGASDNEIAATARLLDPEKRGYINFSNFSQILTTELPDLVKPIAERASPLNQIHKPINSFLTPSKEQVLEQQLRAHGIKSHIRKANKSFRAKDETMLKPERPSKFNCPWKDTFSNHQPSPKTGQYLSETDRFAMNSPSNQAYGQINSVQGKC